MNNPHWLAVDNPPLRKNGLPVVIAPEGTIYVCQACGKKSKNLHGSEQSSWDESCMLNAVLCYDELRGTE